MPKTAVCLLALCFDDLEALGTHRVLDRDPDDGPLLRFDGWELVDLLVDRFPDVGRPTLRYEVQKLVADCGGDPIELLRQATAAMAEASSGEWNERFPIDLFSDTSRVPADVEFDIADAHLHSGASVPLPLIFSALASGELPPDARELKGRSLRSRSGRQWDLHFLLTATRWALRVLRYLNGKTKINDYLALGQRHIGHRPLDLVIAGEYWSEVARLACGPASQRKALTEDLGRRFGYDGVCSAADVFWKATELPDERFPEKTAFLVGLLRACSAISSIVRARPGDGLSRFVDRFHTMGIARDTAIGDLTKQLTWLTLQQIAGSRRVVGAEFRTTIATDKREEFRRTAGETLREHHRAFAEFTERNGRALALSMPVGFHRQPCSGLGGDWTDLDQLREAIAGFNALRLLLADDHENALADSISTIDVAGDEYGSASWPFAAAAALLDREGIPLGYAIHAGEAFYSELNGARRVGELFLADRAPDRIGHALALDADAARQVCRGSTPPPVRIGDAICDLAWSVLAGCGDEQRALGLLYGLVQGSEGKSHEPLVWVDAYRNLFRLEALFEHRILIESGGIVDVADAEIRRGCAAEADASGRVLASLAWDYQSEDPALPDVTALLSQSQQQQLEEFSAATAEAARRRVRGLLGCRSSERRTTIEACPTSNVRLAGLGGLGHHPLWRWSEEGISVVVGSDDPIIFGATIADEFRALSALAGPEDRHAGTIERIAEDTVACCSGGRRRTFAEFRAIGDRDATL